MKVWLITSSQVRPGDWIQIAIGDDWRLVEYSMPASYNGRSCVKVVTAGPQRDEFYLATDHVLCKWPDKDQGSI